MAVADPNAGCKQVVVSSWKMHRFSSEKKSSVILPRGLMSLHPTLCGAR